MYRYLWPRVYTTLHWHTEKVSSYADQQEVINPFSITSLPAESQIHNWKNSLSVKGITGTWKYIETSKGKLDVDCLNRLLMYHTVRRIQTAVQEEVNWFGRPFNKPATVVQHPPAAHVAAFQELLYFQRYDQISQTTGMSPNELAMLCVDRWVSCDHICWLMANLNKAQDKTFFAYLNGISKSPQHLRRFKQPIKPSNFCFCINVGKDQAGRTFVANDTNPGNHWSLCHIDTTTKKIVYGDSLGWAMPDNLLSKVDEYIKVASTNSTVGEYTVTILHDPNGKCPTRGVHKCNNNCAQQYPLQTCGSICGIVVMVIAAIACYNSKLFEDITTEYIQQGKNFPPIFFKDPSRFSKYLRLVV